MKRYKTSDIIRILKSFVKQAGWNPKVEESSKDKIRFYITRNSPTPYYQKPHHIHNCLVILLTGTNWCIVGSLPGEFTLELVLVRHYLTGKSKKRLAPAIKHQASFNFSDTKPERST